MKITAQDFFNSQLITDANSVVNKTQRNFNRFDLFKFAESYATQKVQEERERIKEWMEKLKNLRKEYQESVDALDNVHPDKWKLILSCNKEKYLAVQNAHMQFVMKLDKIIENK